MSSPIRWAIFLAFLPCAVLAAALFGAAHDQISYTVAPEYFTRFKFVRFGLLDPAVPARLRAAEVGLRASWWMGVPLGVLCGAAGFLQRTPAAMARALAWSLPLVACVTLLAALAGLAYGWTHTASIDPAAYRGWYIAPKVTDLRRYLCAGYMHNAAYLGGALAVPIAWIFHLVYRARHRPPARRRQPNRRPGLRL